MTKINFIDENLILCETDFSVDERQFIELMIGENIQLEFLDCDIRSILCDLINRHNQFGLQSGFAVETQFPNTQKMFRSVAELLLSDLQPFAFSGSFAASEMEPLQAQIVCTQSSHLSASITRFASPLGFNTSVIAISEKLILYLNYFFSKFCLLTSNDRYHKALSADHPIMDTRSYDDTEMLIDIVNGAENFASVGVATAEIYDPAPFLGEPYDLCERIEGARQFLVLHEIGHILFSSVSRKDIDCRFQICFPYLGKIAHVDNLQLKLSETIQDILKKSGITAHPKLVEECWCDSYALLRILERFHRNESEVELLYKTENALVGIFKLFFMFDIIERGIHDISTEIHQEIHVRAWVLFQIVCTTINYQHLSKTLHRNLRLFDNAYQFFGGLGFSPTEGNITLNILTSTRVSKFGRGFLNNIFYSMTSGERNAWTSIYKVLRS